jgi:hypothetical protein
MKRNNRGEGLMILLTIVFTALKLTGVIAWSWLWVLSPLWILELIGVTIWAMTLLLIAVVAILERIQARND